MKNKTNDGIGESNIVQNTFTAYLSVSVERRKKKFLDAMQKRLSSEDLYDDFPEETIIDTENFLDKLFVNDISDEKLAVSLAKLTKRDYTILILHAVHNLTFQTIAGKMQLPLPTVKSIYQRNLKKLREELEE